jgi:hypothetical protein
MGTPEPDQYRTATLIGGLPTCSFSSKPYPRKITRAVVLNTAPSSGVKVYIASLTAVPVASNPLGGNNTLQDVIKVPAGQPFFFQWSAVGTLVSDATARVTLERNDNPFDKDVNKGWAVLPVFSLTIPSNAGPNDPRIVIGDATIMPASLVTFYAGLALTIIGGQINFLNATTYTYQIELSNGNFATGICSSGTVAEFSRLQSVSTAAVTNIVGELDIGNISPSARTVFTQTVPTVLSTFYSSITSPQCRLSFVNSTTYSYSLYGTTMSGGQPNPCVVEGWVIGSTVYEGSFLVIDPTVPIRQFNVGDGFGGATVAVSAGVTGASTAAHPLDPASVSYSTWSFTDIDVLIDGVAQPRNFIAEVSSASKTTTSAAINTTETVVQTIASALYRNTRAFKVYCQAFYVVTVGAGWPIIRARRNSASGTLLAEWHGPNLPVSGANPVSFLEFSKLFVNTSGSDVTDTIVITLQTNAAGCSMASSGAGSGEQRTAETWDVGRASDHPGAPTL